MNDIEVLFTRVETLIKNNLQDYIDNMNSLKTDYVLEDYEEEKFFTWELSSIPPYPVFFLLAPPESKPTSIFSSENVGINYSLTFLVGIQENATGNMVQLSHRYLTLLVKLFSEKILPKFTVSSIIEVDVLTYYREDVEEKFASPSITINIPIAF